MTQIQPAPIYQPVVEKDGKATLPWVLFFSGLFTGSTGTQWTPTFQNLTTVGTPTITGTYYKIGNSLVYFSIHIVPATSTTSVAGTTYCDNFPLTFNQDGGIIVVGGGIGNAGMIVAASNRIFPSAWSAVTVPVTIVGIAEAS